MLRAQATTHIHGNSSLVQGIAAALVCQLPLERRLASS